MAERFSAKPHTKKYGSLTVRAGVLYESKIIRKVPPQVFHPPPKVESGVLKLTRKDNFTLSCDEKLFFRVVKQAFMHRRKTLRNSLKTFELSDSLKANVIFDKRPEQLNVQAFIDLTTLIENDEKEID